MSALLFCFRREEPGSPSVNDCLQLAYHRACRHHLILVYSREISILDLEINQTVGIIPIDRTGSPFAQVGARVGLVRIFVANMCEYLWLSLLTAAHMPLKYHFYLLTCSLLLCSQCCCAMWQYGGSIVWCMRFLLALPPFPTTHAHTRTLFLPVYCFTRPREVAFSINII